MTRRCALFLAFALALCRGGGRAAQSPRAPSSVATEAAARFRQLAGRLAELRRASAEEPEETEEQALELLDSFVLPALNAARAPELEGMNRMLAGLVSREPAMGEGYQLFSLGTVSGSAVYALLADFGLSGPSAVRLYAGPPGHLVLGARIDRVALPGFLDDYLEFVPLGDWPGMFITVAGRTDELQTGSFIAWRFEGGKARQVWTSELLAQSSYQAGPGGFTISYCAESEEDRPEACRRRARERYLWDGTEWKCVQQADLPGDRR